MMTMRYLARRLPDWDAPVRFAAVLAVILLILLLALGYGGPQNIQMPSRFGAFGLLVSLQIIFLWANRRDISPYHQAQQKVIAGEYQSARSILESIPESSRASVDALVLLGICYRHLGHFENSRAALGRALQLKPYHHLGLFSAGKLSLVCGDYADAAQMILRALAAGAPEIVRFELGQAYFLRADYERAKSQLETVKAELADDPPQALLIHYILNFIGQGERPDETLIRARIDHWRDEAKQYESTPYGAELRRVVETLDSWLSDA